MMYKIAERKRRGKRLTMHCFTDENERERESRNDQVERIRDEKYMRAEACDTNEEDADHAAGTSLSSE